ncbi:hypothetical protein FRACYDRAFT_254551 [Fragilariopsis cylindrus CCMP1102]|uniref:Uncharacterized protein n=1 Tax=Fragilariopsis cylindrus CCMP1102 TaxID=635003 RepID=A0A1E7EKT1_9STRA|nr:hypothetical protein FRACYDRAFT_254551 [Fragilariopsis cylindrus CCMP1102]|eukprot:OEU06530.1 hypothetical protein FRACYDRAFT_254551 [Fragilariopsis cylindrus CCMP1102]
MHFTNITRASCSGSGTNAPSAKMTWFKNPSAVQEKEDSCPTSSKRKSSSIPLPPSPIDATLALYKRKQKSWVATVSNVDLYEFQVKYPDVVAGASNSRNPYWDGTMECVPRSELFATYEWIVAKQAAGKIVEQELLQLALLNSGRQQGTEEFEFDYDQFLSGERGVNATMVFSTYFQSGSCVDPTPVGTIIQEFLDKMDIALSSGYPSPLSSSALSKVMALVTSTLFVFLL